MKCSFENTVENFWSKYSKISVEVRSKLVFKNLQKTSKLFLLTNGMQFWENWRKMFAEVQKVFRSKLEGKPYIQKPFRNTSLKVFLWSRRIHLGRSCKNVYRRNPKIFSQIPKTSAWSPNKIHCFSKEIHLNVYWTRRFSFRGKGRKNFSQTANRFNSMSEKFFEKLYLQNVPLHK